MLLKSAKALTTMIIRYSNNVSIIFFLAQSLFQKCISRRILTCAWHEWQKKLDSKKIRGNHVVSAEKATAYLSTSENKYHLKPY